MELALLVYFISLLKPIGTMLGTATVIIGAIAVMWWIAWIISRDSYLEPISSKMPRRWTMAFVLMGFITSLFPNEKTAYFMIGAYATQKIAEAPKTQQVGADVVKIIESKIKFYAEQSAKELEEKISKESTKK